MSAAVIPLESNPEIFTSFAHKLGLSPNWAFHDVYSLTDPDLLAFIPRPCHAIIMLFPITAEYELLRQEEEQQRSDVSDVAWFKQTVKNACGLYALLNSISNLDDGEYVTGSQIVRFKETMGDIPKVEALVQELKEQYTAAATQGNTEAPDAEEDTSLHFIAFIKKDGHLFELDGRRSGAWDLGPVEGDDVINDTLTKRFQEYISLADDANKLNFSLMALGPSFD